MTLAVELQARGSVEKVGVALDPKRVGPASGNLEYGCYPMPSRPRPQARGRTRSSSWPPPRAAPSRWGRRSRACAPRHRARLSSPPRSTWTPATSTSCSHMTAPASRTSDPVDGNTWTTRDLRFIPLFVLSCTLLVRRRFQCVGGKSR